jgi:glycosyltransferase 2 family protein
LNLTGKGASSEGRALIEDDENRPHAETSASEQATAQPGSDQKPISQGLTRQRKTALRRESLLKKAGFVLSLVIAGLSLFVLTRTLANVDINALRDAIAATSAEQITSAFLLTALSFLALTGYDGLALRQLRLRVPYRTAALASFTSYAISFTLGFPLITAGTVRYWIYSQAGLNASKVASLTVIAGVTFWLGMALVIGVALTTEGHTISTLNHLDPTVNRLIGFGVIAALLAYLVWVSVGHRRTRIQGLRLELPGLGVTLGQIVLGVIDLCSAAGVLYVLLPSHRLLDFFTFAATYVFGCVLGIASNAPGGIGVFEAAMLKVAPVTSEAELLASLLLFRVIYYLIPFVLALAFIGAHEAFRRWKSLREAMIRSESEKFDDAE